jgi:hypothetical protein
LPEAERADFINDVLSRYRVVAADCSGEEKYLQVLSDGYQLACNLTELGGRIPLAAPRAAAASPGFVLYQLHHRMNLPNRQGRITRRQQQLNQTSDIRYQTSEGTKPAPETSQFGQFRLSERCFAC